MPDHEKCPICGGLWFEGLCYKCGAYMENGKVIVPKPETPSRSDPPPTPPVPSENPVPPKKSTDDGWDDEF